MFSFLGNVLYFFVFEIGLSGSESNKAAIDRVCGTRLEWLLDREYRNSHPWINAIRQSDNDVLKWAMAPENDFVMGRDAYIESRINSSTTPWACVMDGK